MFSSMKSIFLLLSFLILSLDVQAQMFSVGGDSDENRRASSTFVRSGYASVDFMYEGDPFVLSRQQTLEFQNAGFIIGIESPVLSGSMSLIDRITGSDNIRYFNLSIDYNNRFSFIRKRAVQFGVPINIFTSLVNVQSQERDRNFGQSTLGIGSGLFLNLKPAEKISFGVEGTPYYGFSNSDGGLFGGTNKGITSSARLNFLNVFYGRSVSLGYDFKYSSYDIDGEEFDYDLQQHLITLGISL